MKYILKLNDHGIEQIYLDVLEVFVKKYSTDYNYTFMGMDKDQQRDQNNRTKILNVIREQALKYLLKLKIKDDLKKIINDIMSNENFMPSDFKRVEFIINNLNNK